MIQSVHEYIGGFTFKNVRCADLGLHYVPELSDTYIYSTAKYNIHQETFDSHNGGYFYGTSLEPKEFTLRCYFENKHINKGSIDRMRIFFKQGTTGELCFEKRPWLKYIATVVSVDLTKLTNYMNGFVTIVMRAYYPYATYDRNFLDSEDEQYFNIQKNTGLIPEVQTPSTQLITSSTTEQKEFLLYNGGTEYAKTKVILCGNASEGVTISNATTNQSMHIVKMNIADGKYICDGLTGKCIYEKESGEKELKFLWHDYGFIDLAPSYPIKRDVYIETTGSTTITAYSIFDETDVGKYVYLNDDWYEIKNVINENNAVINKSVESGSHITNIVTMNKIVITPDSEMNISYLKIEYKPTFS